jgi:hypothetical protein
MTMIRDEDHRQRVFREIKIDDSGEEFVLPELEIGQAVRVFRTHSAGTLWLYDPETGAYAEPAGVAYVREDHAVGTVRERQGDCYRVTVLRSGRELYIDWTARYWIRLSHEPPPMQTF